MRLRQRRPAIALFLLVAILVCLSTNSAAEKSAAGSPPTRAELANATYSGIASSPIRLTNGHWEGQPYQPGAATHPTVGLLDRLILHTDLNGDGRPESVVTLWQNTGGSGTQLYLAVFARTDGKIINLATDPIGDRVQIQNGRIEGRGIVLDVIQAGSEDAACCPGQKARRSWLLETDKNGQATLTEMPAHLVGRLSLADIENIDWQLRESESKVDGNNAAQPITLHIEKKRISGFGGCNRYQTDAIPGEQPGSLKTGVILTTQMACADNDMTRERQYLKQLSDVSHFAFSAGELLLTVKDNNAKSPSKILTFQRKPQ